MRKICINKCFGGFGLSDKAYEKMIELGIPVRKYIEEQRSDGTVIKVPENEGEVIFDRELTPKGEGDLGDIYWRAKESGSAFFRNRYWETWTRDNREHPAVILVVEELGAEANGDFADLKIVEIPDDVIYEIDDYDGRETVREVSKSWS